MEHPELAEMRYINGYDDPEIIAGAGTLGVEMLEQVPDADVIVVPVGGAGRGRCAARRDGCAADGSGRCAARGAAQAALGGCTARRGDCVSGR